MDFEDAKKHGEEAQEIAEEMMALLPNRELQDYFRIQTMYMSDIFLHLKDKGKDQWENLLIDAFALVSILANILIAEFIDGYDEKTEEGLDKMNALVDRMDKFKRQITGEWENG